MLYIPFPFKCCSKCGEYSLPTTKYFYRRRDLAGGLRAECKACFESKNSEWREGNQDRIRQYKRVYYQDNKDRSRNNSRRWVASHRDQKRAANRKWNNRNPAVILAATNRRRARKVAAEGTHDANDIADQYRRQNGKCYYCGKSVGEKYHVDHVVPLSRGGSDGPENIVIACPDCNQTKNDRLPHEWSGGGRLL